MNVPSADVGPGALGRATLEGAVSPLGCGDLDIRISLELQADPAGFDVGVVDEDADGAASDPAFEVSSPVSVEAQPKQKVGETLV